MEPFFSLIALLLAVPAITAIAALVRTINLGQEVRYLESRLAALERARAPEASAEERSAPPATPARDEAPAPPEPELPSEAAEPVQPATPAGPPVAVIPPAGMSLEERLGTRWTVWGRRLSACPRRHLLGALLYRAGIAWSAGASGAWCAACGGADHCR